MGVVTVGVAMADEELSVASSTSWWVLEEELKRQKRSSNCVIKFYL